MALHAHHYRCPCAWSSSYALRIGSGCLPIRVGGAKLAQAETQNEGIRVREQPLLGWSRKSLFPGRQLQPSCRPLIGKAFPMVSMAQPEYNKRIAEEYYRLIWPSDFRVRSASGQPAGCRRPRASIQPNASYTRRAVAFRLRQRRSSSKSYTRGNDTHSVVNIWGWASTPADYPAGSKMSCNYLRNMAGQAWLRGMDWAVSELRLG